MNDDRRSVLQMLADGKITADEAERLIAAMERNGAAPRPLDGPSVGQNGLSAGARHGLISEWYSAVEKIVCFSVDGVSIRILPSVERHTSAVSARREAKLDGPGPHSASRFLRAWSTPRSENPNRSSTT